jgi:hypothetical protein
MALNAILQVFPNSNQHTWKSCDIFLPHALVASDWPEVSNDKVLVSELLSKVWSYLYDQGRWGENVSVASKALTLRREMLGEKHPDTIRSMANLAATYHGQGRWNEAEAIKVEVLALWRELLGEKHLDTI